MQSCCECREMRRLQQHRRVTGPCGCESVKAATKKLQTTTESEKIIVLLRTPVFHVQRGGRSFSLPSSTGKIAARARLSRRAQATRRRRRDGSQEFSLSRSGINRPKSEGRIPKCQNQLKPKLRRKRISTSTIWHQSGLSAPE